MSDETGAMMVVSEAQPGSMVRQDFGGSEIERPAETASAAVAAQARAAVEARYVLALRKPRDWDHVRAALLKECRRPGFAARARYSLPRGKSTIEGPTIRFAEAALRAMRNVLPETMAVYDDAEKRIVRVSMTDLEANLTYSQDIVVRKVVEKSSLRSGQVAISARTNSEGKRVYLVPATDDELLMRENALVSKALRTAGLRLLPGDILEECMDAVVTTVRTADAKDPDAARKALADAFAALNVMPDALKEYLGHDLGSCSPAELADLRALYSAIKEGSITWADAMDERRAHREEATPAAAAKASDATRGNAGLKARVAAPPADAKTPDAA